ncbi:hypothetical protein M407DRAFT_16912 [Tulasnella calospora MUT 4182]|uniref:Uncharacterized protein n=1 Tax=Tulasnella calospora MUT 4182 TaxID=1051891 RepID=A0A0C3QYM5_9AGAM|nr:hypothetical protein M407DRAFT_16912 [Tulasnella calospora MUT 4182]
MVEPAWFAAVRGTVALVALVVTFAFGALNVVVNPTQQFHHPLPRRAIPIPVPYEAGFPDTLNGVIWLKRADYRTLDTETYPIDTFKAAFPDNFTQVFDSLLVHASPPNSTYASRPSSTDPPQLNSTIPCEQYKTWHRYLHTWDMDIGISWTCWGLRQGLAYSMLDSSALSPIIRLNWTGSSVSGPILRGYVTDLPIWEENRLWMESFGSWNVSVGANVRLNLGRRAIYTRPGSFLEMKSMEIIEYPVASATFSSMELSSQTIIEISPSFGGFYDNNADAWEEYLEHTVLEGLAATGGLYTAFDLVYALVFGRSIIGILFGGKPLSPFGVLGSASGKILRKRLLLQYPGLETDDAPERSKAVCDFLCDFLLDIGPAQPTRNTQDAVSHYPSNIQLQGIQGGNRIAEPGSERRSREEPRENSTASAA